MFYSVYSTMLLLCCMKLKMRCCTVVYYQVSCRDVIDYASSSSGVSANESR